MTDGPQTADPLNSSSCMRAAPLLIHFRVGRINSVSSKKGVLADRSALAMRSLGRQAGAFLVASIYGLSRDRRPV